MQNIDLICVGKLNAKYFAEGVAEYQKRLAAFASFRIVELPEEKIEEKNASDAVVKKALDKEGRAILGSVRRGAAIVACASRENRSPPRSWRSSSPTAQTAARETWPSSSARPTASRTRSSARRRSGSAWAASRCPTSWPALSSPNRSTAPAPSTRG